jgi:hypothetical protein
MSGSVLYLQDDGDRTRVPLHKGLIRVTNGSNPHRIVATLNPRAGAVANQRLGPAPRISQHPRGCRYFRKPRTRGWSKWWSARPPIRPDHKDVGVTHAFKFRLLDEYVGAGPPCHSISSTPPKAPLANLVLLAGGRPSFCRTSPIPVVKPLMRVWWCSPVAGR